MRGRAIIVNLFCAMSLLIFASGMALWPRSYWQGDAVWLTWKRSGSAPQSLVQNYVTLGVETGGGLVRFVCDCDQGPASEQTLGLRYGHYPPRGFIKGAGQQVKFEIRVGRFQIRHDVFSTGGTLVSWRQIVMPLWVSALFAGPPLLWLRHRRRRRGRGFPVTSGAAAE